MKTKLKNQNGFTLFELMMVIALVGILSISAIPIAGNTLTNSQTTTAQGTVGMIQTAIYTFYADQLVENGVGAFPGTLDAMNPDTCEVGCFAYILIQPITSSDWEKTAPLAYRHIPSNLTFSYDPTDGSFE